MQSSKHLNFAQIIFVICISTFFSSVGNTYDGLAEMQKKYAGKTIYGRIITKDDVTRIFTPLGEMGNPFFLVIEEIKAPGAAYKVIEGCKIYHEKPYNYICYQREGSIKFSIKNGIIESYKLEANLERALESVDVFNDAKLNSYFRNIVWDMLRHRLEKLSNRTLKISFSGYIIEMKG